MNVEIANKLVQLRKKHGLSQEALAEQIGVSRQAVSKWERAESSPDTDNLLALARIYNLSLDEMLNASKTNERSYNISESNKETEDEEKSSKKIINRIPVAIIVVLIYLSLGFIWGLWRFNWLVYLLIPIWYFIFNENK